MDSSNTPEFEAPDAATIDSLANKLEQFAGTLSEQEQRILSALMYSAMDPLDRAAMREGELFSEDERAVLEKLETDAGR